MEVIVFWIVIAIVAAIVAGRKNRSGIVWFFACIVLTPLAILVLLALPSLAGETPAPVRVVESPPTEVTKTCPQCAESVKAAAKICRFCRFEFRESAPRPMSRRVPRTYQWEPADRFPNVPAAKPGNRFEWSIQNDPDLNKRSDR